MTVKFSGRAGIREIAESLGISIGTVDRALHGRQGISSSTRDRVLQRAAELHYTPNVAAQHLKRARELHIAAFLPEQIASFFDRVREGVQSGASRWSGTPLRLTMHTYPHLGSGDIDCMQQANWLQYDGVILAPGDPEALGALLRSTQAEMPEIVYVASDAPRTKRLAAVTIDSTVSGGIAAELLGRILSKKSKVVAITGDRRVQDHASKLGGFAAALALHFPHLTLLPSIETHELSEEAYRSALALFRDHADIGGIYVTTADSMPVLRAARECGRLGSVEIITTDLSPELVPMLENGQIFASLYQRPFTQGEVAVDMLCRHLLHSKKRDVTTTLAPHIVLRSNLSLFTSQVSELP